MRKIVSFTTIPTRIHKIKPMVDSLLNQTLKPDEIILWIPESYKRIKSKNTDIPNFIKESNIKVEICKDLGPFTKLHYALKKEWEHKETIIVTVDDDVYYPPKWFKNLIRQSKKMPNAAIGYRGRVLTDKLDYNSSKLFFGAPSRTPLKVDILTGTWGVLYKVKFFGKDIFNQKTINRNFFVDDIWITGNLSKNNIERFVIKNIGVKLIQEIHEIDALWSLNKLNNNNNKMLQYFKGII